MSEPRIRKHGRYQKLRSFQAVQLVYDVTIRFWDRHIDKRIRNHDQMACAPKPWRRRIQAAMSGVQNIAKGGTGSGKATGTTGREWPVNHLPRRTATTTSNTPRRC
jgi:hypothetical protein